MRVDGVDQFLTQFALFHFASLVIRAEISATPVRGLAGKRLGEFCCVSAGGYYYRQRGVTEDSYMLQPFANL